MNTSRDRRQLHRRHLCDNKRVKIPVNTVQDVKFVHAFCYVDFVGQLLVPTNDGP